jgi:hypothetical protein
MTAPQNPRRSGAWTPQQRYTPGVGAHYTTPDTPHRPASSFREIANPLGYEEKRLGMGGGVNSERHTQDLMGGMSVVIILAAALVSSIAFPPLFALWVFLGVWILVVKIAVPYGERQLAWEAEQRDRAAGVLPPEHAAPAQRWYPGAPQ